jgi:VanZ family protein
MTDEWHQSFVPNRTSSVKDVLIDATGALIVLVLTLLMKLVKESLVMEIRKENYKFKS